ncbi:MAG: hypothetical protein ACI4MK_02190, partial [Aristaeellaceae bacterium]
MDISEAKAHAGRLLDGGCQAWVEERVRMALPHYIWTWQEGRHKTGVCTSCRARLERLDKKQINKPEDYDAEEFDGMETCIRLARKYDGTA